MSPGTGEGASSGGSAGGKGREMFAQDRALCQHPGDRSKVPEKRDGGPRAEIPSTQLESKIIPF